MQNGKGFWILTVQSLAAQELLMPGEKDLGWNFWDGEDLRAAGGETWPQFKQAFQLIPHWQELQLKYC